MGFIKHQRITEGIGEISMNVETSILIKRPIEEVFTYMTDPAYQSQYDEGLKDIRYTPQGRVGLGTKITEVRSFLGRKIETTMEVIDYEPNRKYARTSLKPFPLTGSVTFTRDEKGVKVTWRWEGQPGGFFALAEPVVTANFRNSSETTLKRVKEQLESGVIVRPN